jgi:phage gp16-like protein
MMGVKSDQIRKAQLGLIHAGKKALAYDDDVYRQILKTQCNVTSAADLDAAGRAKIIEYMRAQGFQPPAPKAPKRRREAAPIPSRARLWAKIDAQLCSLGKDRSYLDGQIKTKLAGNITAWEFADEQILGKVIAALAFQQKRTGAPQK